MEGDVSLSAEDRPPPLPVVYNGSPTTTHQEQPEELHVHEEHHTALRFLIAGGVAGAGTVLYSRAYTLI